MKKALLNRLEKENIIRSIEGCQNRICVSDDVEEIISMLDSSHRCLCDLAYNRILEIEIEKLEIL